MPSLQAEKEDDWTVNDMFWAVVLEFAMCALNVMMAIAKGSNNELQWGAAAFCFCLGCLVTAMYISER